MTDREDIAILKRRLEKIENKLFELSKEIISSTETSNIYWSGIRRRAAELYEMARAVYSTWNVKNIPKYYNEEVKEQIKRIKGLSFQIPKKVNALSLINSNVSKQTVTQIINDSISTYVSGTLAGEKKYNQLIGSTQQLNLTEKQINQVITEGFEEDKNVFAVAKKIQKSLVRDAIEKKYIRIINKNGKPVDYTIKSYALLVARTKIREAQTGGVVNVAISSGSNLVQVSKHNTITPYDAQFEGKIFSVTGDDPDFPSVYDLPPFHPNCLHSVSVTFREIWENRGRLKEKSDFSKEKIKIKKGS